MGAQVIAQTGFMAREGARKEDILTEAVTLSAYDLGFDLSDIRDHYTFDFVPRFSSRPNHAAVREKFSSCAECRSAAFRG